MDKGYHDADGPHADPLYKHWKAFDDQVFSRLLAPQEFARMVKEDVADDTLACMRNISRKYDDVRRDMAVILDELNIQLFCDPERHVTRSNQAPRLPLDLKTHTQE